MGKIPNFDIVKKFADHRYLYDLGKFRASVENFKNTVIANDHELGSKESPLVYSHLNQFDKTNLDRIFQQFCPWLDALISGEGIIQARGESGTVSDREVVGALTKAAKVLPHYEGLATHESVQAVNNLALSIFLASREAEANKAAREKLLASLEPEILKRIPKPPAARQWEIVEGLGDNLGQAFDHAEFFRARGYEDAEIEAVNTLYKTARTNYDALEEKPCTEGEYSYQCYLRALMIDIFHRLYKRVPYVNMYDFNETYKASTPELTSQRFKAHPLGFNTPNHFTNHLILSRGRKKALDPYSVLKSVLRWNFLEKARLFNIEKYFSDADGFSEAERAAIRTTLTKARANLESKHGLGANKGKLNSVEEGLYRRAALISMFKENYGFIPSVENFTNETNATNYKKDKAIRGHKFFFADPEELLAWLNGEIHYDPSKHMSADCRESLHNYMMGYPDTLAKERRLFGDNLIEPDFLRYFPKDTLKAHINEEDKKAQTDNDAQRTLRELGAIAFISLNGFPITGKGNSILRVSPEIFDDVYSLQGLRKKIHSMKEVRNLSTFVVTPIGFSPESFHTMASVLPEAATAAALAKFSTIPSEVVCPTLPHMGILDDRIFRIQDTLNTNTTKRKTINNGPLFEDSARIFSEAYYKLGRRLITTDHEYEHRGFAAQTLSIEGLRDLYSRMVMDRYTFRFSDKTLATAYAVAGVPNTIGLLENEGYTAYGLSPSLYLEQRIRSHDRSLERAVSRQENLWKSLTKLDDRGTITNLRYAARESMFNFEYELRDNTKIFVKALSSRRNGVAAMERRLVEESAKAIGNEHSHILFAFQNENAKDEKDKIKYFRTTHNPEYTGADNSSPRARYILEECNYRGEILEGGLCLGLHNSSYKVNVNDLKSASNREVNANVPPANQGRLRRIVSRDLGIVARIFNERLGIALDLLEDLVREIYTGTMTRLRNTESQVQTIQRLQATIRDLEERLSQGQLGAAGNSLTKDQIAALKSFEQLFQAVKRAENFKSYIDKVEDESSKEGLEPSSYKLGSGSDQIFDDLIMNTALDAELSEDEKSRITAEAELIGAELQKLLEGNDLEGIRKFARNIKRHASRIEQQSKGLRYSNLANLLNMFAYNLSLSIEGELLVKEMREKAKKEAIVHVTLDHYKGESSGFDLAYFEENPKKAGQRRVIYEQIKTTRGKDLSNYQFYLKRHQVQKAMSSAVRANARKESIDLDGTEESIYRVTLVNFKDDCSKAEVVSFDFDGPDAIDTFSYTEESYRTAPIR